MLLWLVIIRLVEDGVGLPKPLCCHKQPAFIGLPHSHPVCMQRARYLQHT